MTDETESGPPQKTVAELLAQHGAQPEGGRRRRRRAADDDDEAPEPPRGRRAPSVSDTAPQAIIDRVSGDTPPPPSRPPRRSRPQGPPGQQDSGARPLPPQQDSAPLPVPPNAAAPTRQTPPVRPPKPVQPPQESGQFARPAPPQQPPQPPQSGQFARPAPPQEQSGYQQRPPQQPPQSGQFVRPTPPQEQSGYQQRPPDSEGLPPRGRPRPPGQDETRGAVPPVRRRPEPQAGPPSAGLSARLDGGVDAPSDEEAPGPMASGGFATPPAQPVRRRRPPGRPAQPKADPSTEQFAAVPDDIAPEPDVAPVEPEVPPAGLAGWRKRRQKVQSEDTEIGGIPPVPPPVGAVPMEPDVDPGQDAFDAGPPTMGSSPPAPMPFVPPHSLDERDPHRQDRQDDLDEYEREFADPAYPDGGPDFGREEYGYRADEYEDEYEDDRDDEVVEEEAPEEYAENASPGKQWLALAGQLALGVVGGAGVWLGFNWLWVNLPAAALVAALLVIVALVWIVRKIRRADDLQTTVLAVLVGLVVTVSPAALLLVAR
ncbi:hypothetical protein [Amycolatopsis sp. NPDC051071]|uniref:hypothetical protein n=1 Tax=Amycolatopsis sp. NPDC051071 TaxID=3154637 RepID=UPI00341B5042